MTDVQETSDHDPHEVVLGRLGLRPHQSAVYLAALGSTTCSVEALARATGLTGPQVHDAVDDLCELGLGSTADGRFAVAPPHAAIDVLITRRQDELVAAAGRLEEARASVGGVLETYLERFRRPVGSGVELLEGIDAVRALVRRMAETAASSVLTVMPRVPAVQGVRASLESDRMAMRRGVDIRTVVPTGVQDDPEVLGLLRERIRDGARVRLHPAPPLQCLLVDDGCAVLPCDPGDVRAGAWVVSDPGLLRPVRLLLGSVWAAGAPVPDGADDGAADDLRVREVFRLLGHGLKDETVARRLDTSVRTVRRLVAEGMRVLGAQSRYEAGILAQRRGWLDV